MQIRREDPAEEEARLRQQAQAMAQRMQFQHDEAASFDGEPQEHAAEEAVAPVTPVRNEVKIGRNEPCTCGSGKKYKHCCGRIS